MSGAKAWMLLAAALIVARPGLAAPSAAELIDAAIAAHGGEAALGRLPDLEMKGTTEGLGGRGAGRRSDVLLRQRADGAYRRETTSEFRGRKIRSVEFYDGEACKRRTGQGWDDLPTAGPREAAAHRLPMLLDAAARDPRAEGEAIEADVACWVISIADGADRASLAFSKEDGRLVAMEYPGTQAAGMGTKEAVRRKLFFRDFRPVAGIVLPHDVEIHEDGAPQSRQRWDAITVLKGFDDAWIRVPDPSRRFIPSEELAF